MDARILSLDEILQTPDVDYATVTPEGWPGGVRLATVDADTMIEYFEDGKAAKAAGKKDRSTVVLVARSMVNEKGERLVQPDQIDTVVEALMKKPNAHVMSLVNAALELNGVTVKPGATTTKNG